MDDYFVWNECNATYWVTNTPRRCLYEIQVVQNRLDRRDAIFQSSEYLAENLAWFALLDANYRNQGVGSDQNVDQALLRVYSAILEFTSEVNKAQNENEGGKFGSLDRKIEALGPLD